MSLYLGNTLISGMSINPLSLFDFKWSDYLLNDVSWLRADTFSWQDGVVYSDAYNHLLGDILNITPETETIGSYTITFYRATDGHKICLADQETTVNNIYTETGVAWYYILDSGNTRFKLPRTKFGFEGLRSNVGDLIEAGLPNITGWLNSFPSSYTGGAFYSSNTGNNLSSGGVGSTGIGFDASQSNAIYGNSTTVQEQATQMYLYFYVGEFSQTATEQTAGLNSELFDNKADVDLSNVNASQSAKDIIMDWVMPDLNNGISITSGFSAPSKGWISISGWTQASGTNTYVYINGVQMSGLPSGGGIVSGFTQFPVSKNDTITWNNGISVLKFFPMKGVS